MMVADSHWNNCDENFFSLGENNENRTVAVRVSDLYVRSISTVNMHFVLLVGLPLVVSWTDAKALNATPAAPEPECRQVCRTKACAEATCPGRPNAICVNDVCGCSATFIEQKDRELVDVSDLCESRGWQLPGTSAEQTSQTADAVASFLRTPLLGKDCQMMCNKNLDVPEADELANVVI